MKALVLIAVLVLAALGAGSVPVAAQAHCRQTPPWPSFAGVSSTARSMVLVVVTESIDGIARKARSIDVLRGGSPSTIDLRRLRPGRTSVDCRGVSGLSARVGDRLVIAFEGKQTGRRGRVDAVAHVGRMRDARNRSGLERLTFEQAKALDTSEPDGIDEDPEATRGPRPMPVDLPPPAPLIEPSAGEVLWSCDGARPGFPRSRLAGPIGVERAAGPVFDGLRRSIETLRSEFMFEPRGDRPHRLPWLRVHEDGDLALFLVRRTRGPDHYSVMFVERDGGTWQFGGYADECRLRPLITHDLGQSEWRVSLEAPPTAESSTVAVDVRERACASGQAAIGRIADPIIEYGEDAIVITIPVRDLDADVVTCPGNPWTPYVVELSQAIGDRALLDGGPWPVQQRWPSEPH